jgi:alpha-galactosidase
MIALPPFARLDHAGLTLLFDLCSGLPELLYCGETLPEDEDVAALATAQRRGRHESQADVPVPVSTLPQSGWGYLGAPAVSVSAQGILLPTYFALEAVDQSADSVVFTFVDRTCALTVVQSWITRPSGLFECRTSIRNDGPARVTIERLAALVLPLPDTLTHRTGFSGRWAAEMQRDRAPFRQTMQRAESFGGRPGFAGAHWVQCDADATTETSGPALTAHLAWSGDAWSEVVRDADGKALLTLGVRLDAGEVVLAAGDAWPSPPALIAMSFAGHAPARQAFHNHIRDALLPPTVASPRKVHLNSWEALGFDLDPGRLSQLVDDAAALGVERFVLDDGWFAGRSNDRSSLGDWTVDTARFPGGLAPLIAHATARGMDFGLWVEPEMVSPDSALYRAHPDWCLHVADMLRPTQRSQLMLDLTQSAVTDYLFSALDALLTGNAIAYLKWDHNREAFPRAGRSVAQVTALYALLDRLRAAHPEVEIESCASGGGRVDLGILSRCTRIWASDNNDAIERLRINDSWFDMLPPVVTGNHVGPSPNPITGRQLAMDFRAKVAVFGHMGVEANPAAMSNADRETLAAHIALHKHWRAVLHYGVLTRINCAAPGVFGWLAAHDGRAIALVAATQFCDHYNAPRVRLSGLEAARRYEVRLLEPFPAHARRYLAHADAWCSGIILSGSALMHSGLALPLNQPETAWLIALEARP